MLQYTYKFLSSCVFILRTYDPLNLGLENSGFTCNTHKKGRVCQLAATGRYRLLRKQRQRDVEGWDTQAIFGGFRTVADANWFPQFNRRND